MSLKRSMKCGEQASVSSKDALAMKSLRFNSSIIGWSAAKPAGGRLSLSPPRVHFALRSDEPIAAFHFLDCAAIALRIFEAVAAAGCQMPLAPDTSPGAR